MMNYHISKLNDVISNHDPSRHGFIIFNVLNDDKIMTERVVESLIIGKFTLDRPSDVHFDPIKHCQIFVYPPGISFDSVRFFQIAANVQHLFRIRLL